MWILVFIVLVDVRGIDKVTALEKYTTKEQCIQERDRIMIEMMKQYPGDDTWTLECRPQGVTA